MPTGRPLCLKDENTALLPVVPFNDTGFTAEKENQNQSSYNDSFRPTLQTATSLWHALVILSLAYLTILGHQILNMISNADSFIASKWHERRWSSQQLVLPEPQHSKTLLVSRQATQSDPSDSAAEDENSSNCSQHTFLIVYLPNDIGQFLMAQQIAKGIIQITADPLAILKPVGNVTFAQVLDADAIILGSSVENGNTHPFLQQWINDEWDLSRSNELSKKVGAAFVTAGGMSAGQESTLWSILRSLMTFQMIVVGGDSWRSAYGAVAITGEAPFHVSLEGDDRENKYFASGCYEKPSDGIHPMFLDKAYGLGARVASVVQGFSQRCNC